MQDEPQPAPEILEAIEACRPWRNDLADPAMSAAAVAVAGDVRLEAFAQRIERADARIAAAFDDVPVPEGLADRIRGRLAGDCFNFRTNENGTVPFDDANVPVARAVEPSARVSRRWLAAGGGGIVAAAVLLTVSVIHFQRPRVDRPSMLETAMRFFEDDAEAAAKGKPIANLPLGGDYPMSPYVRQGDWVRWRNVSHFLGQRGVAYDLTQPGGARATLYVVKHPPEDLPASPSPAPTLTTRGRAVSAWRTGPTLYVLVVDGGAREYRGFLNLPSGPLI